MKKLIPFFLAALMLTGCHSGKDTSSAPVEKPVVTTAVTEATEPATEITAVLTTMTASTQTTETKTTTTKTEETNTVKETYTTPEVEIVEFTTEDVITTSNNSAKVNDDGSIELPIIQLN
ncbi:MAG: membrane lipoprotein lipid attachment site-containing protein [Clostridia bacterium]|nr:membrane lipoprotein lipid attachment site-containing protein [Clostridia bacterium]MBQ2444548.1 membrane lipoprotein lipid attachment site-containing protein [Clostridia bacterium]MBQ3884688.1 membrane lipoprotein lipid attachment site-containing protein [Ruminococcus sp.]